MGACAPVLITWWLNAVTHKEVHPLPRIDELLDKKVFSTLDDQAIGRLGWQRQLWKRQHLERLQKFCVIPFGL